MQTSYLIGDVAVQAQMPTVESWVQVTTEDSANAAIIERLYEDNSRLVLQIEELERMVIDRDHKLNQVTSNINAHSNNHSSSMRGLESSVSNNILVRSDSSTSLEGAERDR